MKMERADSMAMLGVEGPIQMVGIGDAVAPAAQDRAIFTPGASRWYALRVAPQREDQAEAWLKRRGVYAFHPVLLRKSQRFGKIREYQRRYLPGYVFARFRGEPITHRVCSCAFILGALTRQGGAWGILEPAKLAAIHSMRNVEGETEAAKAAEISRRRMQSAARVATGALFTGGAFIGQSCEVVELTSDGGAKVKMSLFGGEVLVTAAAQDLISFPKQR